MRSGYTLVRSRSCESTLVLKATPGTQSDGKRVKNTVNHHFVPRTYLEQFDKGLGIIVYDTSLRSLEDLMLQVYDPRVETNVADLASELEYYTLDTNRGPDDSVERMMWPFENDFSQIKKALRKPDPLPEAQMDVLGRFAAVQYARVNRMALVESTERLRAQAAAMIRRGTVQEMTDEQAVEKLDAMLGGEIPSTPKNVSLGALPLMIDFNADLFARMFKSVIISGAHEFVTSDAPVVFVDPKRSLESRRPFPWLRRSAEFTFPLSRRACLVLAWRPLRPRLHVDKTTVSLVNARTANWSRKHVFARNTGHLADRVQNASDFHDLAPMMGTSLADALVRDEPETEEGRTRYDRAIDALGIPPEVARGQVEVLSERFALWWLHDRQPSRSERDTTKPSGLA